ncbi:hypothetical protein M407DRAFT_240539, partial [Tulasnella calospora MUT 4182]
GFVPVLVGPSVTKEHQWHIEDLPAPEESDSERKLYPNGPVRSHPSAPNEGPATARRNCPISFSTELSVFVWINKWITR